MGKFKLSFTAQEINILTSSSKAYAVQTDEEVGWARICSWYTALFWKLPLFFSASTHKPNSASTFDLSSLLVRHVLPVILQRNHNSASWVVL